MSNRMILCKNKQIIDDDNAFFIVIAMKLVEACKGSRIQDVVKNNVSCLFDRRDFINGFLNNENLNEEQILKLFVRTCVYSRADLRIVEITAATNYISMRNDKSFTKNAIDKIAKTLPTEARKIVKSRYNNNSQYIAKFCENIKYIVEFVRATRLHNDALIVKKWNGVMCDIVKIFNKKINRYECPRRQLLNSECQGNLYRRCEGIRHSHNCPLKATKQCKGKDCEGIKCSVFTFHVEKYIDSKFFSIEKD